PLMENEFARPIIAGHAATIENANLVRARGAPFVVLPSLAREATDAGSVRMLHRAFRTPLGVPLGGDFNPFRRTWQSPCRRRCTAWRGRASRRDGPSRTTM